MVLQQKLIKTELKLDNDTLILLYSQNKLCCIIFQLSL